MVYKVTSRASVFYSAKRPAIRQGSDIPPVGGQRGEFHTVGENYPGIRIKKVKTLFMADPGVFTFAYAMLIKEPDQLNYLDECLINSISGLTKSFSHSLSNNFASSLSYSISCLW